MASLTIRNLDERVKQNLREQAASHGVSMEQEARLALAEKFGSGAPKWKTVEEVLDWINAQPAGKPIDLRYETLDHKTLSDMIWDGKL